MSKKMAACLVLIVLIPLGLLGWLGVRVGIEDEVRVRQQVRSVLLERLRDTQGQIERFIGTLERKWLSEIDAWEYRYKQDALRGSVRQTYRRNRWYGPPSLRQSIRARRKPKPSSAVQSPALRTKYIRKLRQLQRRLPMVRHVFLFDRSGKWLYPASKGPYSPTERAFRTRTQTLWKNHPGLRHPRRLNSPVTSRLYRPQQLARMHFQQRQKLKPPPLQQKQTYRVSPPLPPQRNSNAQPSQRRSSNVSQRAYSSPIRTQRREQVRSQASHGWSVWYWSEGQHILIWKRLYLGMLVGFEIDRFVLMSRIIGLLPGSSSVQRGKRKKPSYCIVWKDEKGSTIYQWGRYTIQPKEKPFVQVRMKYPVHTWSLHYFGPEAKQLSVWARRIHFQVLFVLFLMGCIVIALGVYLFREYTRDMRDAAQRVTFVTQVSHELKTPLTNIRLYAELLEGRLSEELSRPRRYVGVIVDESQRLSRLINNILTFSRQSRTAIKMRPTQIVVHTLIERLIEQFEPSLKAKGFELELEIPSEISIYADKDATEQIVGNLLSNVEKYAAQGQWLAIRCSVTDSKVYLDIQDRGPGIPASQQSDIFQPFFRCTDLLSEGVSGTGIGLTIARELALLQKGDVQLISGQDGACFRLILPLFT